MFSKRTVTILMVILFFAVCIVILSVTSRRNYTSSGAGQVGIFISAPFQQVSTGTIRFVKDVWEYYFFLVSAARTNEELRENLSRSLEKENRCHEIEMANQRLRSLLGMQEMLACRSLAADVIGKDPSPWFKSVIIDKGKSDGLEKGLSVVVPEGIVGLVTDVSGNYSKVLLMTDQSSAVDALIQRNRAPGIVEGKAGGDCRLKYVLRKYELIVGDVVISSGLDGVYRKGLRIGKVTEIAEKGAGIFREVTILPFVDFERLEEVLVILDPPPAPNVSVADDG